MNITKINQGIRLQKNPYFYFREYMMRDMNAVIYNYIRPGYALNSNVCEKLGKRVSRFSEKIWPRVVWRIKEKTDL